MTTHPLLPAIDLTAVAVAPEYVDYLRKWREEAVVAADAGDVAASTCLQGTLIDLALDKKPIHDWLGIMDEFLVHEERPIAYSEAYGKRLYRFAAQYLQSTVHAVYARWWIERVNRRPPAASYADLIRAKLQPDGLIYDADVSETILRHRMKAEIAFSAAMSAEILATAGQLTETLAVELATALVDPHKCPPLGYAITESLRLQALVTLGHPELFPVGIEQHIDGWETGLQVGWSDFAMAGKVDAYMGTAKRTQRDAPVHSPLVACNIAFLASRMPAEARDRIGERLAAYRDHLRSEPFDIRAFQMRDIPVPFGPDLTPLEVLAASYLVMP